MAGSYAGVTNRGDGADCADWISEDDCAVVEMLGLQRSRATGHIRHHEYIHMMLSFVQVGGSIS